jgi:hypothetical protein
LPGYSQVSAEIRGKDTVFIVQRSFLEFTAAKFDSLNQLIGLFSDCQRTSSNALDVISAAKELNLSLDTKILSLQSEIGLQTNAIESYKRSEIIAKDTERRYKKEIRRRKTWQVVGLAAITGFVTTTTILWLKQ